jgi:hypothetical protein
LLNQTVEQRWNIDVPTTARSYLTQRIRTSAFEINATAHSALGLGDPSLQLDANITFQWLCRRPADPTPTLLTSSQLPMRTAAGAIYRRALEGAVRKFSCVPPGTAPERPSDNPLRGLEAACCSLVQGLGLSIPSPCFK